MGKMSDTNDGICSIAVEMGRVSYRSDGNFSIAQTLNPTIPIFALSSKPYTF